jgi:hypothetical protein
MPIQLNHAIVHACKPEESAASMAEILGLPAPRPFGPFQVVDCTNGVSLDFVGTQSDEIRHYAFLVSEAEFDEIWGRIRVRGVQFYADPRASQPRQINHHDGGRGLYLKDPSGHYLEIVTRPYGSGG